MKNIILAAIILIVIFSCKKEKDLGPLYESFIGTWRPVYGDVGDYIEFTKNGHFIYSRGTERQVDFRMNKVVEFGNVSINGIDWNLAVFSPSEAKMYIAYNMTKDTICGYPKNFTNEIGEVDLTLGNQFFVRK